MPCIANNLTEETELHFKKMVKIVMYVFECYIKPLNISRVKSGDIMSTITLPSMIIEQIN